MSFPSDEGSTRTQLDPWRVILACLFELDSHEIPAIIDIAGLAVDWTLTVREDYSHNYRKRAYRPRIVSAYDALDEEDRLRVAFIVSEELAHRDLADKLNANLRRVGWRIDGDSLCPATESVRELFFPGSFEFRVGQAVNSAIAAVIPNYQPSFPGVEHGRASAERSILPLLPARFRSRFGKGGGKAHHIDRIGRTHRARHAHSKSFAALQVRSIKRGRNFFQTFAYRG